MKKIFFFVIMVSIATLAMAETTFTENELAINLDGQTIRGKLLMPQKTKHVPLAIIIAGSGPTDMDGNTTVLQGKNNSLKLLAEGLKAQGIATFRYDKRGIASSASPNMQEEELTIDRYIDDVVQIIDYLQNHYEFQSISIIGHSEGAFIGMIAAQRCKVVKSYTSLAGMGRPYYELIEEQTSALPEQARATIKAINAELCEGRMVENIPNGFEALFRPSVQPFLISCYKYNPVVEMAKLTMPVLIIQGDNDTQVKPKDALMLHEAKPEATLLIVPKMHHLLKECPSTSPQDQQAVFFSPDTPVMPAVIDAIAKLIWGINY